MKYFQSLLFLSLSLITFWTCYGNNAHARDKDENITCDSSSLVCLLYKQNQEKQTISINLKNNTFGTRTVNLDIWRENMNLSTKIPDLQNILVKGQQVIHIGTLKAIDPYKSYSFNFNFGSFAGRLDANHDDEYVYDLPFEPGKKYKLVQGYGGKFSHSSEQNYFSYDFRMPIGDSVHAIRDGIVVEYAENFSLGGIRDNLKDKANYITIEHDDGTYARYSHLRKNGVISELGQKVEKGQKIGLSGNTGYSQGPHLHLSVLKLVAKDKMQSLATKFKVGDKASSKLELFKEYEK